MNSVKGNGFSPTRGTRRGTIFNSCNSYSQERRTFDLVFFTYIIYLDIVI